MGSEQVVEIDLDATAAPGNGGAHRVVGVSNDVAEVLYAFVEEP
jgi:hypothetical protein